MNVVTFLALFAVFSTALASEAIAADHSHCAIKSADGDFNYDPTSGKGPAHWGSLYPEFSACAEGNIQSPINLELDVTYAPLADGPKPVLVGNYFNFSATSANWALTCSEKGSCGSTSFMGSEFDLFNVHFHSPSEHTLDGVQYPLEAHFVHLGPNGALAVIATMFKYADDNEYSSKMRAAHNMDYGMSGFISDVMSGIVDDDAAFKVYPGEIINANKGYCVYTGSLTTPPCTEGVTFFISMNVITVSKRQVHGFSTSIGGTYDGNNRPVNPLNGREITCYV